MATLTPSIPSTTTTIVSPLSSTHTHTLIFLHGREDYGEDLAVSFFESRASDGRSLAEIFPSFKWVFPTARLRYSAQRDFEFGSSSFAEALRGEEIISQWFDVWDVKSPDEWRELVIPGLRESVGDVIEIIREEMVCVGRERIVLGGISQGCATAIFTLLASGFNLGGFIGLSSWLPLRDSFENLPKHSLNVTDLSRHVQEILHLGPIGVHEESSTPFPTQDMEGLIPTLSTTSLCEKSSVKTPVFLSHSRDDETVPFTHGECLHETLQKVGFDVTWKDYEDGGHWIHPRHGVDDISAFLRGI